MGCLVEIITETLLELFAVTLGKKLRASGSRARKVLKAIAVALLTLLFFAALLGILALMEHLFSGLLDIVRFD